MKPEANSINKNATVLVSVIHFIFDWSVSLSIPACRILEKNFFTLAWCCGKIYRYDQIIHTISQVLPQLRYIEVYWDIQTLINSVICSKISPKFDGFPTSLFTGLITNTDFFCLLAYWMQFIVSSGHRSRLQELRLILKKSRSLSPIFLYLARSPGW